MSVMVIVCYRPKAGKQDALLALMKTHLPTLRAEGLAAEGPSLCGRAKGGTIVEVFQWKSQAAIDSAHENPRIVAMWDEFSKVCDYALLNSLAEAGEMFASFEPIDLS